MGEGVKELFAGNSPANTDDVLWVKRALNRLGYYTPYEDMGISDIPDSAVFEGVRKFQKDHKILVTGELRPNDKTVLEIKRKLSEKKNGYYIWHAVKDGKVRPAHAALEGTIHRWDEAFYPGKDYNCRCWGEPVTARQEELYPDAIEPVYPEFIIIPIFKLPRLFSLGRLIFSSKNSDKEWRVAPPKSRLQKKFKHAKDLGVKGSQNNQTLEEFKAALQDHVRSPDTIVVKGSYHKAPVTHYFNPETKVNVMRNKNGDFLSAWKLSDEQISNILRDGNLGGRKR